LAQYGAAIRPMHRRCRYARRTHAGRKPHCDAPAAALVVPWRSVSPGAKFRRSCKRRVVPYLQPVSCSVATATASAQLRHPRRAALNFGCAEPGAPS
jgi:hypothetical protein